ncbi:PH domain-containing protein [Arthrobacter sp. JZ12]|uniref:PH domain-containing protein n=1 Tax=Arthrobacter sp. JZ12 TaxID=2654190 RepID=UPI002B46822E|nr:PH domain-containing protein [Arthrobacter sp. JZ12]WRH24510.1 PH domain-containing protein [Arthrobacter sp. JZ12]
MRIKLEPGEHVVVRTRPHPRRLILPFCGALLILAGAGYGLGWSTRAQLPLGWEQWSPAIAPAILVLAALLLIRVFLRPLLRWSGTRYVLTSRRLLRRSGFTRRSEGEVRLTAILQVIIEQTLVERLTGGGSLVLDLGRDRMLVFGDVPQVRTFKEFIVLAIRDLPLTAMFDGVDMEAEPLAVTDESINGKEQDW